MSDERRERYAAAIQRRATGGIKLNSILPEVYDAADAAMAVADAEQREADEKRQDFLQHADQVNNDLMKEVQRYAEGEEMPVLWSVYNGMHKRALTAEAENGRLRGELEQERTRIQALTEATVVWRDRPGGDVGLAIALSSILDVDKPEPPASATLVRVLAECDRIEREVHGQHDEGDDGMREAIRRIRAAAGTEQVDHVYLSTGCLHGEHGYCQSHTGLSGAKTPAVCKFCKAPCQCLRHSKEQS